MPVTVTQNYIDILQKRINTPNVIIEVILDSGTVKWGYATGGFADVLPIISSVSSYQNKLNTTTGLVSRGEITVTLTGRVNFKDLIAGNYLKNRRAVRKDGFIAPGFAYTDYAITYSGKITDWSRRGDSLIITIADDLIDTSIKIPTENTKKTQSLDYRNTNPINVMQNILDTQLGIDVGFINIEKFGSERDAYRNGWIYSRVITEPKEATSYLNELQTETNSFIFNDGNAISLKVFAPPPATSTPEEWTDAGDIIDGSFSQESGYSDLFFNRVIVYYDYDESGGDAADNYDSVIIALDATSQGTAQWNEVLTKTIYSKWIKSYRWTNTTNITGMTIYHTSKNNLTTTGTITFSYDATNGNSLQWTPPSGTIGTAVKITEDGQFDVYGSDTTKFIRVIIDTSLLPTSNKTDTVTFTALSGSTYATTIATSILQQYRDPASTVTFDVDIRKGCYNGQFLMLTDYKDITSDEAFEKGHSAWYKERLMITSMRPDFEKGLISIEAIETKFYLQSGVIAPDGYPDWGGASEAQRAYAYIGHCNIA